MVAPIPPIPPPPRKTTGKCRCKEMLKRLRQRRWIVAAYRSSPNGTKRSAWSTMECRRCGAVWRTCGADADKLVEAWKR